jgi:hypothetical protein
MACRPGPLRVERSLRDLYIPFGSKLPLVAKKNLNADHREAHGEAGRHATKWLPPLITVPRSTRPARAKTLRSPHQHIQTSLQPIHHAGNLANRKLDPSLNRL